MTEQPRREPGTGAGSDSTAGRSPHETRPAVTSAPEDTMEHGTAHQQHGYRPPAHQPPGYRPPAYQPPASQPVPEAEGPAVGTLVWGLTVLAVAALVALRELTDVRVDLSVVVPAAMLGLGLLLVVGAVLSGLRRRS